MYNDVKASIIIPLYNAEHFIAECLKSAIAQTLKNIEIIVIDDCSTDNSVNIANAYAGRDNRITVIQLEQNCGVSNARNAGISKAKGKYILPLDSDDFADETYLKTAVDILDHDNDENIGVVYCRAKTFIGRKYKIWDLPDYDPQQMLLKNSVHCAGVYRKKDWEKYGGYDHRTNGYEDWNFWLHFTEDKKQFYLIDEFLYFYRIHSNYQNSIRDEERSRRIREQIIKIHSNLYLDNLTFILSNKGFKKKIFMRLPLILEAGKRTDYGFDEVYVKIFNTTIFYFRVSKYCYHLKFIGFSPFLIQRRRKQKQNQL